MDNVNTDKKKLLLVAISVGFFLVITIGAAILVTAGKNTAAHPGTMPVVSAPGSRTGLGITVTPLSPPPAASAPNTAGQEKTTVALPEFTPNPVTANPGTDSAPVPGTAPDPVVMVRNPGDVPGLTTPPAETLRQNSGPTDATTSDGEKIISVPRPTSAAVPDAPPAGRAAPAAKPAPVSTPPKAAPKPAAPVKAVPVKAAPPQPKVYDDYWVQTGAFSTATTAEGVKETLASRGITSIIENREVEGKNLFRVRVGPYTSQNEADYWLSLIKSIGGFEDSQVRLTQSRR